MSRHDRRVRARRWYAAATAAGVVLAAWFMFFRGAGAQAGAPAAGTDKTVEISKSETKGEAKPAAPPVSKKKAASSAPAPAPRPELVSAPAASPKQEPKQEAAPKPPQNPPYQKLMDESRFYEARRALAELFTSTDSDALRVELAERGMALNRRLLISTPDPRDVEFVTVAHGENPTALARRVKSLHGEPGLLFLLNGMKPGTVIRSEAKLRTARGVWTLFVDKSLFRLWLCYEGAPFKEYAICVGAEEKTPATKWTIDLKNPKPSWTAPPEWIEREKLKNPIPYGHARNPLGEYWIGLESPGFMGFGIHGTNEPDTIGTKASNGCVRMLNADVVELAGCVWKGMPVTTME
ncbi:MAG TPA: L,D-transpeptidase [Planctomycetota bacterium]|jgi:L,D-transpeptidase-like protein|nr:L,D-transpeptidase [Planctomycetota bacterium]